MAELRAAFYGDDVTGSVDALLQFARRGWRGRLFVGVPDRRTLREAAAECDVVGIAGIARSLRTAELDAEVRPALEALAELDPAVVQYKACSTVDSSPEIGSLGRVLEIGRDVFGERTAPLLFAQPDFGRYTVFGHHFASEGGVVHRLDRQPTMSTHPSTPMTESDLSVHLSRQTRLPVGSLPFTEYRDAAAITSRLRDTDAAATVLDSLDDSHLRLVGEAVLALEHPVFAIGSGGLSRAIALAGGGGESPVPRATPARGPVLVISGSRSAQTRRQMDAAARAGWDVRPLPVSADDRAASIAQALAALRWGRSVALSSDGAAPADGTDLLHELAGTAAAHVRAAATEGAASRVIICGGDTSSRVIRLLGVAALSIAANPQANLVVLRAQSDEPGIDGVELVLKGGQVGADDLFEEVRTLAGDAQRTVDSRTTS